LRALGRADHKISQYIKTPPSLTKISWYVNPCGAVGADEDAPANAKLCPVGSQGR
jgi:hypothetical protein